MLLLLPLPALLRTPLGARGRELSLEAGLRLLLLLVIVVQLAPCRCLSARWRRWVWVPLLRPYILPTPTAAIGRQPVPSSATLAPAAIAATSFATAGAEL